MFASGASEIPNVEGHELIADAVLLAKPYDESSLAAAIDQMRDRSR